MTTRTNAQRIISEMLAAEMKGEFTKEDRMMIAGHMMRLRDITFLPDSEMKSFHATFQKVTNNK